jgi:Sulfotransferase family
VKSETGQGAFESALRQSRPAFIVGCPRSGTTLVQEMLDAHPNISCGPETLFLRQIARLESQNLDLTDFLITDEEWHAHVRELFLWLHETRAKQLCKTRWVDKSPGYAVITGYLDAMFPNCQIVHVVRNPRDVVDSWRRRWGVRSGFRSTRLWPLHVKNARKFGAAHPDRYFEIRYEELVRSPDPVMRALIEWLEEPWDDRVLQFTPAPPKGRRPAGTRPRTNERNQSSGASAGAPTIGDASSPLPVEPSLDSKVFTSSIGAGRQLSNLPFNLLLQLTCRPLIRELGY